MAFTTVCPNCDARLTAPDTVLGKKVKCKKCDEPFVAKRSAEEDDEDGRPTKPAKPARSRRDAGAPGTSPKKAGKAQRPADDADTDEPRPKAKKKGKKQEQGSPALLIVLVVVGAVVLTGGGVGVYFGLIKEDKPTESTAATGDGTKGPGGVKGPPGGPGSGAWVEHVDADGKYRISFPGRPTTQNQTVNAGGVQQTVKVTQLQAGVEVFVANAVTIPPDQNPDPEQLLNIAEQQAGGQVPNATVTSKQPVTHAGVNGRELVLSIQGPGGAMTGVVRLFVNNGRIYTFGIVGPTVQASSPNAVKYFESLKFD